MPDQLASPEDERLRRWRLILGDYETDKPAVNLTSQDQVIDQALTALYETDRQGGLDNSAPKLARWLGDIRTYFPDSVVQIMQRDALSQLDLRQLLLEPTLLEAVEPDVQLVADLLALQAIMPAETRRTAKQIVRRVVDDLLRKLTLPLAQAVKGSLNRAARHRRPRQHEIDWEGTIRANLKHYQPAYKTILPIKRVGYSRKQSNLHHIILCVDQSGSMATSVVYAGIFGAALAALPAIQTNLILFDTSVVDLTAELTDPVELLFGSHLGGGTDINRALSYCQTLVRQPRQTTLILITDLYEGGRHDDLLKRALSLRQMGLQIIVLLALNDEGAPSFNSRLAAALGQLDIPVFACTPDQFPDLMAAALQTTDMAAWAASRNIILRNEN